MDGGPAVDAVRLQAQMQDEVKQCFEKLAACVNAAAPGRLLSDTEEVARDALHKFSEAAYQKALQQKIDAAEAAFPPSEEPRDRKDL